MNLGDLYLVGAETKAYQRVIELTLGEWQSQGIIIKTISQDSTNFKLPF
jgi:hypothetical protein